MALIEWKPEFSLGMPEVDTEHRDLIDIINRLYEKIQSRQNPATIVDFLAELRACATKHFVHEEQVMQRRGYSAYDEHRADHARLLDELDTMMNDLQNEGLREDDTIADRLHDWFCNHFKTYDAPLHRLISSYLLL